MISSLPKPLQNDFDTIVIDLLSRYSIDNKSVQKFVQTVAQQVRDINRVPRILRSAKLSTGKTTTNTDETKDKTEKPNFITRLENLQTTFNKGGLLGVLFEHLKNKQADAKAQIAPLEDTKTESQEKDLEKKEPQEFKLVQQDTEVLEKTITSSEKLQEAFDSKGLINIVQNIFNLLKNRSAETPVTATYKNKDETQLFNALQTSTVKALEETTIPIVTTESYTTDTLTNKTNALTIKPQSTNYSTVNASTAQTTDNTPVNTTNLTTGGSQAQAENLLPDEIDVVLGGINDQGETDLKRILKSVFEDILPKEKRGVLVKEKDDLRAPVSGNGEGMGGSLLEYLGIGSLLKGAKGLLEKTLGGAKNIITSATRGLLRLAKMPAGAALTGGGGVAGALGAGAAIAGGEIIGGEIGKAIISNEKFSEYWYGDKKAGKEAAEQFGTGIIGATKATWALGSQMLETRKSEAAAKKAEEQFKIKETKLVEKIQQLGYKTKEEYIAARKIGQAPALKWDVNKNEYIEINTGLTNSKESNNKQMPVSTIPFDNNFEKNRPLPVQNPEVIPLPSNANPPDIEKPFIKLPEVGDALVKPDGGLLVSSPKEGSLFQLSKRDGLIAGPMISQTLIPETTKINPSIPSSITETHITNNNTDKKILSDIAGNTEKTNKSLATLGDAVFKLAKVLDSKTMGGGNSVLINNNGKVQEYTSTAQIAANNQDSIRVIRQQFLSVT